MFMKNIIPFKKEIIFKTNISEIISISLEHELSINDHEISGEFIINGDYKISDNSMNVSQFNYKLPFYIVLDLKYDTSKAIVDIEDFYYEIIDDKVLSVSIDVFVDKLSEVLIPTSIPNIALEKDVIRELFDEDKRDNSFLDDTSNLQINSNDLSNDSLNKDDLIDESGIHVEDGESRCIDNDDILPGNEENLKMHEKKTIETKDNKEVYNDVNDKINSLFSNTFDGDLYVSYIVYILRDGDTLDSIYEKYSVTEDDLKKYNNLSDLKLGDKIIIPAK